MFERRFILDDGKFIEVAEKRKATRPLDIRQFFRIFTPQVVEKIVLFSFLLSVERVNPLDEHNMRGDRLSFSAPLPLKPRDFEKAMNLRIRLCDSLLCRVIT